MERLKTFAFAILALSMSAPAAAEESIFVGPDVGKETPIIIDSVGEEETIFRAIASSSSKSKPSRWALKLDFFVHFKGMNKEDVIMLQVMKGRKKLAKPFACSPRNIYERHNFALFQCEAPKNRDYDKSFKTAGEHTIKLTYKKPIEGKSFKDFAEFKVVVKKLKKGSQNDPYPSWSEDHDAKLMVSTIEEKTRNGSGKVNNALLAAERKKDTPYAIIHTWFKRTKRLERTKLVCLLNGKRVAEGKTVRNHKFDYWSFVKKGSPKRDDAKWIQAEYFLYKVHPRPGPKQGKKGFSDPQHWLNENPGEYKCLVTGDGEILKELYFTVGKDGEIVKPKCQLASMNTLRTVTLLKTKNKKLSDRKYDKRRGKKLGYEGRVKWAKGCPADS